MEKKLDGNYTRMLWAILKKSWRQHSTKEQLCGHLPPITKTIQVRQNRHAGHCWRGKEELISDVLLWTSSHGRAKAGRLARTYIQQLCADTGCSLEDLPRAMDDRDGCRERVRDIRVGSATWLWYIYIYIGVSLWIEMKLASLNSSHAIAFTFELIPLERYECLIPHLALGKVVPLLFFHKDGFGIK